MLFAKVDNISNHFFIFAKMECLLDLNLLNTFVAVVEAGSMTQAARRLKQPISRVSRALSRLERDLKQQLILRTTRSFKITTAGQSLFREIQPLIQKISDLEQSITNENEDLIGIIRITAPEDFAQTMLSSFIVELSILHPGLQFDLNLTDDYVDLVRTGTDIGIRGGRLKNSTLKVKYIGESNFFFVASPNYLEKFGVPKKPDDLLKHRCIYSPLGPNSQRNEWVVTNGARMEKIPLKAQWKVNHKGLAANLAKEGLGITLLPGLMVNRYIDNKELVRVLPAWGLESAPVHLIYPPQRTMSRKVREVSNFLETKLKPLLSRSK